MHILEFGCDDGNALHLGLGHGIDPAESEEVVAVAPLFLKTRGHYAAFGRTQAFQNISIKLDPAQIQAMRKITTMKSVPYQTLVRQWPAEGIRKELNLTTK